MKTITFLIIFLASTFTWANSADYRCEVRSYDVYLTLTQDRSTSMVMKENYRVLANSYAGSIEKKSPNTIFYFYPQLGPIELTFKTQDTIDLPERLSGRIYVDAPFLFFRDRLNCIRTN